MCYVFNAADKVAKISKETAAKLFPQMKQNTSIYCSCGNELCSSDSFVSDTYDEHGDNHVLYRCTKCGKESDFNFDIAPVPVSWGQLSK
jgi:RNase P subunit RPR2